MINLVNKIYEMEKEHNKIKMELMRKRLEDLNDSKNVSTSRVKSDASVENERYLESLRSLNYFLRRFEIERCDKSSEIED